MNTTDVLAELDDIAGLLGSATDKDRIQSIRTRIAALVEAAKKLDLGFADEIPDTQVVKLRFTVGEFKALSSALKAIGHG